MKFLALYFMLAFMGLFMTVIIDILTGLNLSSSLREIHASFAATSLLESTTMIIFISLPFISAVTTSIRKKSNKSTK